MRSSKLVSRLAIVAGALAVFLVFVALGGLAAFRVWLHSSEPVPPPPHDERELPALPEPEDNGVDVIAALPEDAFEGMEFPADEALRRGSEGPPSLAAIEAMRDPITAWPLPGALRAAIDEALSRPRFALPCELDLRAPECPVIPWMRARRAATGLALRDAVNGEHDSALARTERILIADRDVLAGARTVLTAMIAEALAESAIELVGALALQIAARGPDAAGSETLARLDGVERALVALDPASWSLEPALIGESIQTRRAVELLARDGQARRGLARAIGEIDAYFEAVIAYARDPEHNPRPAEPDPDDYSSTFEPYGALAVSAGVLGWAEQVDRFRERACGATDRVEAVRVALAAARAGAAAAPVD